MKTIKIKIYGIKWNLKNSFYDDIPNEFVIEEDYDNVEHYDGDADSFAYDWIMYNGSKWGAKPKKWKVDVINW